MKKTLILFVALTALILTIVACEEDNSAEMAAMQAENESMKAEMGTMEADMADMTAKMAEIEPNPIMEGGRLEAVKERGVLICSSNNTLAGFGYLDDAGNTMGFDIDLCRAVAAAVLGDPDAVEFRTTTAAERGPVMQSGEVDMMSRNTTWTTSRDVQWGNFAQTMFYDGQGFMAPTALGISSLLELKDS